MTFNELNIAEPILRAVCEKGYERPTPIQEAGIPVALEGRDMLGIAQTGTGKTAVFAIPILQHLAAMQNSDSRRDCKPSESASAAYRSDRLGRNHGRTRQKRDIKALVLTPTRELAVQIDDSFTDYGKYFGLKHTAIYGGVKQRAQTDRLRSGVDILIATPGRLFDLIGQGFVRLDAVDHFVLDEADRMLDMGFVADIKRLLPLLPKNKQTLLFSATMPKDIVALSESILSEPVRVEVTPASSAVEAIDQSVYFVEKPQKKKLLVSLLKQEDKSVLIFSRTKHGADNISDMLSKSGIRSEAIHGNKSQSQRQRALSDFKSGRVRVMVATDIAARGIDIQELQVVINYDVPEMAETYVHRIGRTGRAGHAGVALTFCSQDEHAMVKGIQKLTGKRLNVIPFQV